MGTPHEFVPQPNLHPIDDARRIDLVTRSLLNVEKVFAGLDKGHKGLSLAEINQGIRTPKPPVQAEQDDCQYALPLVVLKHCNQSFKLLNDDGAANNNRVSLEDKAKYSKLPPLIAMRLLAGSAKILSSIDSNSDKRISPDELKALLSKTTNTGIKTGMQAILDNFDKVSGGQKDLDIAQLPGKVERFLAGELSPKELAFAGFAVKALDEALTRLDGASTKIFEDDKSPRGEFVRQSRVGDCEALAAFCSQAARNPAELKRYIKENPDGTLTVTFPFKVDGEEITSTISKPTRAELALYASSGPNGIWANVFEKALGQYLQFHPEQYERFSQMKFGRELGSQFNIPAHEYANGAGRMLEAMTGKQVDVFDLKKIDAARLDELLKGSQSQPVYLSSDLQWPKLVTSNSTNPGRLLGAPAQEPSQREGLKTRDIILHVWDSDPDDVALPRNPIPPNLDLSRNPNPPDPDLPLDPRGHAFAALHYNEKNQTVTLYNPWQHGELTNRDRRPVDGKDDGIMVVHISNLNKYFASIYVPRS